MTYFTVGEFKKLIDNLNDDVPIVSAPLNDKVKVALDVEIVKDAQFNEYKGDLVVFTAGLFDIETNNPINLKEE